jgi:DNA repair protein RecN (Recombination protein N)
LLQTLHIQKLALIENAELSFGPGLNVLTGETGAGKSMIIDAVSLVLGGRTTPDLVRSGADSARVEALFELQANEAARLALEQLGLAAGDNLVLSREVHRNGRSACRVNGRLANLGMLQKLAPHLVDMHGQYEHQSLLRPSTQLLALDTFGGMELAAARASYHQLYVRLRQLDERLQELAGDARDRARRLDLLRYEVNELERAALRSGEDQELAAKQRLMANRARLADSATGALQFLYGGQSSVASLLGASRAALSQGGRYDPALARLANTVEQLGYQVEEIIEDLRGYCRGLEFDPAAAQEVEARLDLLARLKRKYGDTVDEMLAYLARALQELARLESAEELASQVEAERSGVKKSAARAAQELGARRRGAAASLDRLLEAELAEVGMAGTSFATAFGYQEHAGGLEVDGSCLAAGPWGVDQIEFTLSPNPGEPLRGLAKVASGGELSRVMLALRTVLARADQVPTLIFDEIDAGIGGRTAVAVADKLARLADDRQVLCVTHLAHIAARAGRHLLVEKHVEGNRTCSRLIILEEAQRPAELARMLGVEYEGAGAEHARELLMRGRQVM